MKISFGRRNENKNAFEFVKDVDNGGVTACDANHSVQ